MITIQADKLAKRLRGARKSRGLTQEELAAAAGISVSTVSKLEQGQIASPSAEVMVSLAEVLKFEVGEFVRAVSKTPKPKVASYVRRPKVGFVYFDIGGVLVHTEAAFLQPLSQRLNRPLHQVKAVYHSYITPACRGKLSQKDLQILMLLKLNVRFKGNRRAKVFKNWVEDMEPIAETHEFLEEVAAELPVGLLTNTIAGFVEDKLKRGLLPGVEYKALVKSSDEGLVKPEPAIYELAAKRAKTPPAQILFIDNERANVAAALKAGWQAEWFDEFKPQASIARIQRKYFA